MRRALWFAVGLLLGGFSVSGWAYTWPAVQIKAATNGVPVLVGTIARGASTAAGGGAAMMNASALLGIGSASAPLTLAQAVSASNLAAVARAAARIYGPLALAGLVVSGVVWVADHWETEESSPSSSPGIVFSKTNGSELYPSTDPQDVCDAWAASFGVGWTAVYEGSGYTGPAPSWTGAGFCHRWFGSTDYGTANGGVYYRTTDCLSGDTRDPVTGICMTPGAGQPATEQQIEDAIAAGLQANPSLAGQVLDAASGYSEGAALLAPATQTVTGPATVNGGTSTSTKVETAGTTTTQVQTTYNITYAGDVVTITETNVETVTHPDATQTVTTTTTAAPTGDPPPQEPVPDVCEENPDASGCAPLGEHEPEGDLETEDRSLSWVPTMSAAGSCPAPEPFTVQGQSFNLDWGYVCDFATGIRPVVLAVAWLSAAIFVFGVGRGTVT